MTHVNSDEHRSDLSVEEARQAVTPGWVRYVLGISTALVVVAFFAILWSYSGYMPH